MTRILAEIPLTVRAVDRGEEKAAGSPDASYGMLLVEALADRYRR